MYIRKEHRFPQQEAALALVDAHPLGAWVCHGAAGLLANHVPFLLDRGRGAGRGAFGTLIGHVSRANPVWRALHASAPSVVMFQGVQSYITPGWYPGKAEHGKVVPTWNYAVVHAHGIARAVQDRGWLLAMLRRLTDAQEAGRPTPWRVDDAPADYIDGMLRGIVGIEIPIDRLEAKLKASQDEDLQDRVGTVGGLQKEAHPDASSMAQWVHRAIETGPQPPS